MSNHHDPRWVAHINAEFPELYNFYWGAVMALRNYGALTGKDYFLEFPTIILKGTAWLPNASLTVEEKDVIMNMIVKAQGRIKKVLKTALADVEPMQKNLKNIIDSNRNNP